MEKHNIITKIDIHISILRLISFYSFVGIKYYRKDQYLCNKPLLFNTVIQYKKGELRAFSERKKRKGKRANK